MKRIISEAIQWAAGEVGVREVGNNRGKRVEEYLRAVGLPGGNPWCAAFTYLAIDRAAAAVNVPNPLIRTGYCPYVMKWAEEKGFLRETPEVGDLFLRIGKTAKGIVRAHHIGFVATVAGDDFGTIEGNTNLNGSSEGVGVFRRSRRVGKEYSFVRWADAVDEPKPARQLALWLNGKQQAVPLLVSSGVAWIGVRVFAGLLGVAVSWDNEAQAVRWGGELLPVQTVVDDGVARAQVRDLVETLGGRVTFDGEGWRVLVDVQPMVVKGKA